MSKEINAILGAQTILIWTYDNACWLILYVLPSTGFITNLNSFSFLKKVFKKFETWSGQAFCLA